LLFKCLYKILLRYVRNYIRAANYIDFSLNDCNVCFTDGTIVVNNLFYLVSGCGVTVQSSYFSSNRQEVYGSVMDSRGVVKQQIFGRWAEAIYVSLGPDGSTAKCIWRPGNIVRRVVRV
jgi:hypothetical protein